MSSKTSVIERLTRASLLLLLGATTGVAATVPAQQTAMVQHGFGGPEVLKVETVPVPEPGEGQVLLKIYAAGVNPVDWKQQAGVNGRPVGAPAPAAPATPIVRILGSDASGVIAKVGPGVTGLTVGESVVGSVGGRNMALNGAYEHYALATAEHLMPKPKALTYEQAAGLGVASGTAALALYRLNIQPGQTILITGIAGGVGSAMAQFAKAKGARVMGTATQRHTKYLKSLGVDAVIDYTQADWPSKAKDVDVVFDTIGGPTALQAASTLKKTGKFLGIANENGELSDQQCAAALIACVQLRPARPGDPSEQVLHEDLSRLIAEGKFTVHVDKALPLEQAAEALQLSKEGHTEGKIILVVDPAQARKR